MNDQTHLHEEIPNVDFQNLDIITALGRGAKGVVFLARNVENKELLALKVISRALIERKKSTKSPQNNNNNNDRGDEYKRVCFEREVLRLFQHPLLPQLRGVLDTQKVVGYAIDYCSGRDLNTLRKKQTEKMFSDDVIRFYAAELVMALEYVHSLGIVYRDLKPENVMLQQNGHIMLVDFDLSTRLSQRTPKLSPSPSPPPPRVLKKSDSVKKKRFFPFHSFCNSGISPDDSLSSDRFEKSVEDETEMEMEMESDSSEKSNSFVGTEEYVAPEIVAGKGHDFAVDWWSLGVVLYEMLYGTTPFRGINRKETFYRILTKSPDLCGEATALRDLIKRLLEKDPRVRIELEEIKGHDFFKGIDWDLVLQLARPPSVPEIGEEDMEGNSEIDVESVVQEIFSSEESEKVKDRNNNHTTENNSVCGKELSPTNYTDSDRILLF